MDGIDTRASYMNEMSPTSKFFSPINITGLKFVTVHSYTIIVTDGD